MSTCTSRATVTHTLSSSHHTSRKGEHVSQELADHQLAKHAHIKLKYLTVQSLFVVDRGRGKSTRGGGGRVEVDERENKSRWERERLAMSERSRSQKASTLSVI